MSTIVNETNLDSVITNGVNLDKVVCNGVTVFESVYVISWDEPLATADYDGTATDRFTTGYMGETTVTKATSYGSGAPGAHYGNRRIRYTKPDGTTGYANPYFVNGSFTIKKGTAIYLEMFSSNSSAVDSTFRFVDKDGILIGNNSPNRGGYICGSVYTPNSSIKLIKEGEVFRNATWWVSFSADIKVTIN